MYLNRGKIISASKDDIAVCRYHLRRIYIFRKGFYYVKKQRADRKSFGIRD